MLDPVTILLLASAGVKFAREAVPAIREMFAKGEVVVEKQAEVRALYESLRNQLGGEYQGEHWELSGRS